MTATPSWSTVTQGYDTKKMQAFVQGTAKYSTVAVGAASSDDAAVAAGGDGTTKQQVFQGGFVPKGKQRENQKYEPKTPLGMVDISPEKMQTREHVFTHIKSVFKRHGAVELETPVCELKETLMGKYGEDSKLVYDLQDQGGELLSLRYDLTVPFARYLAQHGVDRMRRFHIARVYRRDRPNTDKGRYREFYQCDFDAAGEYEDMVPDAECIKIVSEILSGVGLNEYLVKVNHRGLLDGVFGLCGVPASLYRPICSAVDKLDKEEWSVVREEMLVKGIDATVADKLGQFVQDKRIKTDLEGLAKLVEDMAAAASSSADPEAIKAHKERCLVGLAALRKLNQYATAMNVDMTKVTFDMSMARGLDYYTGVIYEVVLTGKTNVGSIAGGGRYDNLVGMFHKKGRTVPCVGISIGIERLFAILEDHGARGAPTRLDAFVAAIPIKDGENTLQARMKLCASLWDVGLRAEFVHKANPKLLDQFQACEKAFCRVCVYFGPDEVKAGVLKVRRYKYVAVPADTAGAINGFKPEMAEEVVVKQEDAVNKVKEYLAM